MESTRASTFARAVNIDVAQPSIVLLARYNRILVVARAQTDTSATAPAKSAAVACFGARMTRNAVRINCAFAAPKAADAKTPNASPAPNATRDKNARAGTARLGACISNSPARLRKTRAAGTWIATRNSRSHSARSNPTVTGNANKAAARLGDPS